MVSSSAEGLIQQEILLGFLIFLVIKPKQVQHLLTWSLGTFNMLNCFKTEVEMKQDDTSREKQLLTLVLGMCCTSCVILGEALSF